MKNRKAPLRKPGPGRPRKAVNLRELVARLATENRGWGYSRLVGELVKLGLKEILRTMHGAALHAHPDSTCGCEPAEGRGSATSWASTVCPQRLCIHSPNLNAFTERWVKSVRRECLDHFIAFGEQHLGYLLRQYVEHFHEERPPPGAGQPPAAP